MMALQYQHESKLGHWLSFVLFVLVLGGLISFVVLMYQNLSDRQLAPMSRLLVSGERKYVADADLQQILAQVPQAGNFFTLDVDEVQSQLEALPWIKSVTLRKQWPDKLRIRLLEHQPLATWNGNALVDVDGEVFQGSPAQVKSDLVFLSGPDKDAVKVKDAFALIGPMLELQGLKITSMALSNRHSWDLRLDTGLEIIVGQEQLEQRIAKLLRLYPQLEHQRMQYIDLRYDTGFAVGWKQQGSQHNDESNG
ncbi:FtsQ-type POTRA domain-containing protein [Alginatibacterium sediminis]|uniref:Cell division protein FtsQ n=1 Tax=Alginatibacterium sediminis TaxID=2164068 RepID=A0A420E934_9ALTE|nr:cell division protein FtsQ/DivIB [Alginatibacterium sediminis]RKF15881.1 FtsQ-type POTRA domain-containing protein [Alginatibacterium sediminis]